MKKTLILLFTILLVIIIIVGVNIKNIQKENEKILQYNAEYEYYCKDIILGTDITTLINKATNENEKNSILKDKNKHYIEDEEKSIKIFIKFKSAEKEYPMENFYKAGINEFTGYFGSVRFKCSKINYHKKTNMISQIYFEEQN